MHHAKTIGWLLLSGGLLLFGPYTALTLTFDYPQVLRLDAGAILTRFHAGGPALIFTWLAFAATGLPLIPAYVRLGQSLEAHAPYVRAATTLGVAALVLQLIGLLRWVFVVPVLADTYVRATDAATRAAAVVVFRAVHQFGGVLLGEHLGQLFTIGWTVALTTALRQRHLLPRWLTALGYGASAIYLLAQAELVATVVPGFPVWAPAGFIGSTLWLVWLMLVGGWLVVTPPQERAG